MSGNKIKLKKNISKNLVQDLKFQNKLQLFSSVMHPKISINKIFIDCLSIEDNKKKNKINSTQYKSTPKHKSFSLNKYTIKKNPSNPKYGSRNKNSQYKIIINCLDEKQKNKINKNINEQKSFEIKKISNGSTQKSSETSPFDNKKQKENEIPHQNWKSLKINCISLKKKNEPITRNIKFKEKEELTNIKENRDVTNPVIPTQLNSFLNNNKGNNTTGKKEIFYHSVYQKKIEPLKLFDHDVSSSSSSIEEDKEGDENVNNNDETKKENNIEEKPEKDIVNDYQLKKSEDQLSDELKGSKEEENIKKLLQKIRN